MEVNKLDKAIPFSSRKEAINNYREKKPSGRNHLNQRIMLTFIEIPELQVETSLFVGLHFSFHIKIWHRSAKAGAHHMLP